MTIPFSLLLSISLFTKYTLSLFFSSFVAHVCCLSSHPSYPTHHPPPVIIFLPWISTQPLLLMSSSHRASLLNGLRTGGVRSVSASVPHTSAPAATTFSVNRFPTQPHPTNIFPEEDNQLPEMPHHLFNYRNPQRTAAVDGNSHLPRQQAQYLDRINLGFSHPSTMSPQSQAMSMQMLQLEMMRIQVGFLLFSHPSYLITLFFTPKRRKPSRISNIRPN